MPQHDGTEAAASHGNGTAATPLTRAECLELLAGVPIGRIVFSHHALPAIRPVNHLVDGDTVVIRAHNGAAIVPAAADQVVVAYEADEIDAEKRTGWSVIVTGIATLLTDPEQIRAYEERLHPWFGDRAMAHVIRIQATKVTGIRLS